MPEIDFKLQPSRQHAGFLAVVALFAILSVFSSSLPILMRFLLALAVMAYALRVYHQVVQQAGANSLLCLRPVQGRVWALTTPQGVVTAKMQPAVVITPWVSVLRFKAASGAYACMLFRDSLTPGQYRQFLTKV